MTLSHVSARPIRASMTLVKAYEGASPRPNSALAAFFACSRHPWPRCYINWHSSHPNLLFFSPESTPGNKIDNPSISTTHSRQTNRESGRNTDESTIITIRHSDRKCSVETSINRRRRAFHEVGGEQSQSRRFESMRCRRTEGSGHATLRPRKPLRWEGKSRSI